MKRFAAKTFAVALLISGRVFAQDDPSLSDAANAAYLAQNAKQAGTVVLPDGLQYTVIREGSGGHPSSTDSVDVAYKGWLINGKVFDQASTDNPATFRVYKLIPGWTEALTKMSRGAVWRIVIPANLAYGAKGTGDGTIPPNQTLVFEMTLIDIHYPSLR